MNLYLAKCNIFGKLGAIFCWCHDNELLAVDAALSTEEDEEISAEQLAEEQKDFDAEAAEALRLLVKSIRAVVKIGNQQFKGLSNDVIDAWWQALGEYTERDEQLERIYLALGVELRRRDS